MIWFTWRQHRFEALIALACLWLFTAFLIPTGLSIANAYHSLGVSACTSATPPLSCGSTLNAFWNAASITNLVGWANFLPLVFGTLLAAPFVLDLESGTYRLAWTQSITRNRWMLTKIGILALGCVLVGAALSLLMSWWRIPLDHLEGSFAPNDAFDFEGIVPIGYVLFSVALVVMLGTTLRRTVPAIGISLGAYLAVRLGVQNLVRPHFLAPLTKIAPATGISSTPSIPHGSWVLGKSGFSDAHGHLLSDAQFLSACGRLFNGGLAKNSSSLQNALTGCMARHHIFSIATYQPASRFWLFQGIEFGLFAGLSVILFGISFWWVRRMA